MYGFCVCMCVCHEHVQLPLYSGCRSIVACCAASYSISPLAPNLTRRNTGYIENSRETCMKQHGALLRCSTVAPSAWWYIHFSYVIVSSFQSFPLRPLPEIREVSRYDGSMKASLILSNYSLLMFIFLQSLVVIMSNILHALVIRDGQ
jgi:hypothetical protein